MKNDLLYIALAAFALTIIPTQVKASDSDAPESNKYHITTVKWIKATKNSLDEDERYVVLCGTVTKEEGSETYWLNDGTGTVKLDSVKKLPAGKPIVIRGHIDQAWLGMGSQEVDVRSWRNEPAPK